MATPACTSCAIHTESTFRIEGLCCHTEAATLERRLTALPGVERLTMDVVGQRLRIAYDAAVTGTAAIAEAVAETGMRAWVDQDRTAHDPHRSVRSDAAAPDGRWDRAPMLLLGVATVALGLGLALQFFDVGRPAIVPLMLLAVLAGGLTTWRRAVASVKNRTLDMYVLMLVAVIGAVAIQEWSEAATVIVLFAIAQQLERRSMDRARRALDALLKFAPTEVRVRRGADERRVSPADVHVGETMIVAPGERVSLDGIVTAGQSDVNQAPVTGESVPVAKEPGDRVFAGTVNGHGALDVQVTAVGEDTTLARIIHLVERAQAQRAPSQAWVDRFALRYTPIVLGLAVLVALVPPLLFAQPFALWLYRALVLLVIACPCALVISTPVSIVSALAAAARRGVLVKGGMFLEKLAVIKAIALDKTGTLTTGTLSVEAIAAAPDASPADVLRIAATLGDRSEHPLARAIARHASAQGVTPGAIHRLAALPGQGAQGDVDGVRALIGSRRLFEERGIALDALAPAIDDLLARGMTVVLVARGDRAAGVIGLRDELRRHGREAIDLLRAEGIVHVTLLTGDHERSARAAGEAGRVDTIEAGLLPGDKVDIVHRLRAAHGPVLMVGDGINDAPALAAADVGVAMGVAGTDAAIETADVALMADDLRTLSYVVRLGRATIRTIQTNIAIALGLKLAFVLMAVAGVATLWMAVLADTGASLIVVANGLRLLRTR